MHLLATLGIVVSFCLIASGISTANGGWDRRYLLPKHDAELERGDYEGEFFFSQSSDVKFLPGPGVYNSIVKWQGCKRPFLFPASMYQDLLRRCK